MAKNNKQGKDKKEGGAGGKVLTALIIILIVLIWLAILALLIKFDVGGLGSQTLRPLLKDIPVINRILPDISEEQEAAENKYPFSSLKEAIEYIKKMELTVDNLTKENEDYARRQLEMQQELDTLRHYEEEHEKFLQEKEAFDREVVFNSKAPSTDEYLKWYASMYPDNAAKIYEELMEQQKQNADVQSVADWIAKMKAKDAAKILQEFSSNIDFVCRVLRCLKNAKVTEILSQMDSLFAARVLNRMDELVQE